MTPFHEPTRPAPSPETREAIEERQPLPLDRKIVGGVALIGALTERHIADVTERLQTVFNAMRQDGTNSFGENIAFGLKLPEEDMARLDQLLIAGAQAQNHGMFEDEQHVVSEANGRYDLWVGVDGGRRFYLHKYIGPLLLDDDSFDEAVTYSLLSGRF